MGRNRPAGNRLLLRPDWKGEHVRQHLQSSSGILQADAYMGVPKGKLTPWSNLRLRAIDPAIKEVNLLSDYVVELMPIKTGRSVTHVELRW